MIKPRLTILSLFLALGLTASFVPRQARACDPLPDGWFFQGSRQTLGAIPTDGALVLPFQLKGVEVPGSLGDSPISIEVLDTSDQTQRGSTRLLDVTLGDRGSLHEVLVLWTPRDPLPPETDFKVVVENQDPALGSTSDIIPFRTSAGPLGALDPASILTGTMESRKILENRVCCTTERCDSCGDCDDCWYTYLGRRLFASFDAEEGVEDLGQWNITFRVSDETVARLDPTSTGVRIALPKASLPYCITVRAEPFADPEEGRDWERCFEEEEIEVLTARATGARDPSEECTEDPRVVTPFERHPSEPDNPSPLNPPETSSGADAGCQHVPGNSSDHSLWLLGLLGLWMGRRRHD